MLRCRVCFDAQAAKVRQESRLVGNMAPERSGLTPEKCLHMRGEERLALICFERRGHRGVGPWLTWNSKRSLDIQALGMAVLISV
jgi:hypothetical protein